MRSRFEYLLKEAAKVIKEDDQMGGVMAPPVAPQGQAAPPPLPPAGAQQPPAAPQPEALTIDSIVDRLNVIRGGKSFTEPETYKGLSDFFNTIPQTEREVIDRFLTGIGKVVINAPGSAGDPNTQVPSTNTQTGQPPAQPPMQQSAGGAPPAAPAMPAV